MTAITSSFDPSKFRTQLEAMLQLQHSMNSLVAQDWHTRNFAWHRAIYVEAAEYLEHLGTWKWWKKGTPDWAQARMELVDIWHFGLSLYMVEQGLPENNPKLTEAITTQVAQAIEGLRVPESVQPDATMLEAAVDQLVASAGQGQFNTLAFMKLLEYSDMTLDTLLQSYIGKNVLNRFRQDNGYKTGTYLKLWAGREDNVHLDEIVLEAKDVASANLYSHVYAQLSVRYKALNAA